MIVAILCPGPSMPTVTPPGYDTLIGVNRAALAHRLDWWVFTDPLPFVEWSPAYKPRIFTSRSAEWHIGRMADQHDRFYSHELLFYEDPTVPIKYSKLSWGVFSSCAALALANYLKAERVDVYGHDLAGTTDYDGFTDGRFNRNDERWWRETSIWDRTRQWIEEHGTKVTRVRPDVVTA